MSRTIFYDIENFEPWRHQEKIFKHTSLRTFLDLVSGTGMTGIAISWPGFDDDGDDDDDDDNLDHAGSSASGPEQQSKLKLSNMEKSFLM